MLFIEVTGDTQAFSGSRVDEVMRDTWGHLDAPREVKHLGTIVFAESTYGERFVLSVDFGENAGDGPWFYQGLHDWLDDQHTEPGKVYRFTGWYRRRADDTHDFVGEIAPLTLTGQDGAPR